MQVINQKLNIPLHEMHLSKNPALLTSKAPQVLHFIKLMLAPIQVLSALVGPCAA